MRRGRRGLIEVPINERNRIANCRPCQILEVYRDRYALSVRDFRGTVDLHKRIGVAACDVLRSTAL